MQIQNFLSQWEALASDAIILQTVKGEIIDFIAGPPSSLVYPSNTIAKEHRQGDFKPPEYIIVILLLL